MALLTCDLCDQPAARPILSDHHTFCCHGCRDLWRILGEEEMRALRAHPGVQWSRLSEETVLAPNLDEGRESQVQTVSLSLQGVWCPSCAVLIEHVVQKLPGVFGAQVDTAHANAQITYDARALSTDTICAAITGLGYEATCDRLPLLGTAPALRALWRRLMVTATLSLFTMMLSVPVWMGYLPAFPPVLRDSLTMSLWILSTPVILWGGWPFLKGAWTSVRHLVPTMDLLIAIGALTAYAYGIQSALRHGSYYYFDTADMLVVFLLLGRTLEAVTRRQADKLLASLSSVAVADASLVTPEGERLVPIGALTLCDHVHVRPGQRVPADGQVIEGLSSVDESIITGESLPVTKARGDTVYAGTLNHEGRLIIAVTRIAKDSILAQTAQQVQTANLGSARMRERMDRILHWFVPTVLTIGLVTFLSDLLLVHLPAFQAMMHAAAIFIIACPCALSVATPLALSAAAHRLVRHGVLIRGSSGLESLSTIDTVVLDKTGTLTEGVLRLTHMSPDDPELLILAASADDPSEHPLARALVRACQAQGHALRPSQAFTAIPGWGVTATIENQSVAVSLYDSELLPVIPELQVPRAQDQALVTSAALTVDGILRALFSFQDHIRPGAKEGIDRLQSLGLNVLMATGDAPQSAQDVAGQLGIADWRARVQPSDKAKWVRELQEKGHHVLFIGDGINDALALMQADVGMAVGLRTDIAAQAGDLLQVAPRMETVADIIKTGRKATAVIRQNVVWAIVYNACALVAAILGVATPLLAALAMVWSSLFVLMNSMRIVDASVQRMTKQVATGVAWLVAIVALAWWRL